ncbi:MAG: hypothetical protein LBQ84_09920 [Flavobacteriaceae bacterium]|jgi:hypothetical protein|nr:hypothetical protein [Flavobacteriaceae bacterium]
MARLLEFILFAVVAYFVFKFLNQLFSGSSKANTSSGSYKSKEQKKRPSSKRDINWDAETVDYEEVETKDHEKK